MHVLPRVPHHAAGRRHRVRPARARRQIQEDGGDRHAPGHAQELMLTRTNDPPHLTPAFLILSIGYNYLGTFCISYLIGHPNTVFVTSHFFIILR